MMIARIGHLGFRADSKFVESAVRFRIDEGGSSRFVQQRSTIFSPIILRRFQKSQTRRGLA